MPKRLKNRAKFEEKDEKKLGVLLRTFGWPYEALLQYNFTIFERVV